MAESKRYEFSVSPKVTFLADQSDPDKNHYVFAYTITVTNNGPGIARAVTLTDTLPVFTGASWSGPRFFGLRPGGHGR